MERAKDFYAILGVPKDVAKKELTKAYRVLVKKYHPDHNPDDPTAQEKFRDVQSAYDVLSDPEKRQIYDEFGIDPLDPQAFAAAKQAKAAGLSGDAFRRGFSGNGPSGGGFRGGPGGFQFESNGAGFDFSQLFGGGGGGGGGGSGGGFDFSQLFGAMGNDSTGRRGSRRRAAPVKGRDLEHDLTIPFRTAIQGGNVSLRVRSPVSSTETLEVKIPAGIEDGKRIRLRGQGEPSSTPGVAAGDLLLRIHVSPDPYFRREGNHLVVRVPVTYAEATLGGKVDIPSPHGVVTVKIPAGTASGKRLRVRGQGVAAKGGPGDLFVEVCVDVPKNVDEETSNLIRTLDRKTAAATRELRGKLRW